MNPYYTGLGIARSLSASRLTVYGLASEAGAPAAASRFFKRIYRVPSSRNEPAALCEALLALKDQHADRPVIFPTRDFDVLFLHRHRENLSPFYRLAQDSGPAIPRFLDKVETARIAELAGVASPRTVLCRSRDHLEELIPRLLFPVVIKPRSAHEWRTSNVWTAIGARKAILAASADQLRAEIDLVLTATGNLAAVIQEFIPGDDRKLVSFGCYWGSGGKSLGYFTGRKLRQTPPEFGTGCVVELVEVPEIIEPSFRLLAAARYEGPAEIEYKLDDQSGNFTLIEVNPRLWDQHELGRLAGINVSLIAYRCVVGRPPDARRPEYPGPPNGRWIAERELALDVLRGTWVKVAQLWRIGRGGRLRASWGAVTTAISETLGFHRGRTVFALSSFRDPVPTLLLLARVAVEVCRAAAKRLTTTTRGHQ